MNEQERKPETLGEIVAAVDKIGEAVEETKVTVAAVVDVAKTSEILALGQTYREVRASEIAETLLNVTAIWDQAAAAIWSLSDAMESLNALEAKLAPRDTSE